MTKKTQNETTWHGTSQKKQYPILDHNLDVDVAILGGGLAGVTIAYILAKAGKSVALLEKEHIGSGATGMTTAMCTYSLDTDTSKMISMFGKGATKAMLDSHSQAIDIIESIALNEGIDCEFTRCPNYLYANDDDDREWLEQEQELFDSLGFYAQLKEGDALQIPNSGYLEIPNQAIFHPTKYLYALAQKAIEAGAQIYEHTEALKLSDDDVVTITTKDPEVQVRAERAVMATYVPFNRTLFFKKALYISYVMEAAIPAGAMPIGIYEDQGDPYHYFRVDPVSDYSKEKYRLIVGGEDHRSDIPVDPSKNFQALEEFMNEKFGHLNFDVVRYWRGPIAEPVDGIAFMGKADEEHVYYVTGFSGNGMTYATIAGAAVSDAVLGHENLWMDLYAADRRPTLSQLTKKGMEYGRELFGGAVKNVLKYRTQKNYHPQHSL